MVAKPLINLDTLEFPKPSLQAARLLNTLAEGNVDLQAVDHHILQDPVLAGVIIRYANSPLYRRGGEIANVPTATRLIGLKNIRSAVVMAMLSSVLPANTSAAKRVQRHALGIASLARLIAHQSCPELADDLELLGLLHDIGMVVLVCNAPYQYDALLLEALTRHRPVDEVERQQLGFSHDRINRTALHEFRLPVADIELLDRLHQGAEVKAMSASRLRMRAVLLLAHYLLAEYDADAYIPETLAATDDIDDPRAFLLDQLDIDPKQLYQDFLQYRHGGEDQASA